MGPEAILQPLDSCNVGSFLPLLSINTEKCTLYFMCLDQNSNFFLG